MLIFMHALIDIPSMFQLIFLAQLGMKALGNNWVCINGYHYTLTSSVLSSIHLWISILLSNLPGKERLI